MRLIYPMLLTILMLASGGCSTTSAPLGHANDPYPLNQPIALNTISHLPTGTTVSFAQMMTAIHADRLVYVGETHDNPASHRLQQQILQAMLTQSPGQVAVGMEMFHSEQQPVLDAWIRGELNEKEFLRQLNWYDNWRIDYRYYRELLELMRDRQLPIIALNASPAQKMAAMKSALKDQSEIDPYYRATLLAYFDGHQAGTQDRERFIRIQSLWDDTMAQSVVDFLDTPERNHDRMLVLAGGNHIRYGFGIPRRVFQQRPLPYILIGNKEIEIDEQKRDRFMDVSLPELPLLSYHYLQYNRYEALPERMQLGVLLEQHQQQVIIADIVDDSIASRLQLQPGDVIRNLGGQAITEVFDVIYTIQQQQTGDTLPLEIERGEQRFELVIHF